MNWQSIIIDLRSGGMTLQAIADATGTTASTISEISRGATAQPRGNLAAALIRLHAMRHTDEPPADPEPSREVA